MAAIAATAIALLVPATGAAAVPQPAAAADVRPLALPPYSTWIADVTAVANQAGAHLDGRLPDPSAKPAIVLDIDNTSLQTTYKPGIESPATAPVLAVAKQAKAAGAAVFFVTARPEIIRVVTRHNLHTVGYPIDGLYMKGIFDLGPDRTAKTNARIAIERRGYVIVANIGNRDTDLAGGHAERTFKLPDYDNQLS